MLTSRERQVLDFERGWWQLPGPKDRNIYDLLGFSSAAYYRILRAALDKPAALSYDPLTVRRLRQLREAAAPGRKSSIPKGELNAQPR